MPNSPLHSHIQSLVAKAQTATARQHLLTLANSLPSAEERAQVIRFLEEPASWEEAVAVLDQALASLNPEQLKNYNLALGNDNISLQNIVGSVVNIHVGSKEKKGTHFLTLDHHRSNGPVIGRSAELQKLEAMLQAADGSPVVIWGASGIGKSLLAELYWEKHKLSFDAVGWLNYQTSFIYTLLSELKPEHADYLDLEQAPEDKLKWYAEKYILHELQNRPGRKLLVLNNVTADADVAAHLPALNIQGLQLLITAKDDLGQVQAFALPTLNDEEIIELFATLSGQTADAATQELLAELGQNALLTKLIARNVPHEDLREARDLILALKEALLDDTEEEEHTPEQKVMWHLMQYGVADAAEQWVLIQFAAMPAMEISLEHFKNLVMPEWSQEDVFEAEGLQHYLEDHAAESEYATLEEMIQALVDKGWLETVGEAYMLPEAIRACIELHFETYAAYFIELIDSLHLSYFGEEYGKVMGNALFVTHLKAVLPFLEYGEAYLGVHRLLIKTHEELVNWYEEEKELQALLGVIEIEEGQWSENYWKVCRDLAECCISTGHINLADQYSTIQLAVAQRIYPAKPSHLGSAQNIRGAVLRELGEYHRAAEVLEGALKNLERSKSLDYHIISAIQSTLAAVLRDLGDLTRSKELFEKALEINLRNLDPSHRSVAVSQSNLAILLNDLGDHERAAELLEKVVESDIKNFGQEHPSVSASQSNLATVYQKLGKYSPAAELLETALKIDILQLGQDHSSVGIRQSNLAAIYQDLGQYNKALELYETALKNAILNFGQKHPLVSVSQSNLATIYQHLGDYSRAAELLEQALEYELLQFGEEHPSVLIRQSNLATVLIDLGENNRAAELLEKVISSPKLKYDEKQHPILTASKSSLARIYEYSKDYKRAAGLLEEVLAYDLKHLGNEHPDVAHCRANLAMVLSHLGDNVRAIQLLEEALASDLKNYGDEHPYIARCQVNLANVLSKIGDYSRATQLLEDALASDLKNLGANHPNVAISQSSLANVYFQESRFQEAKILLEQALETIEKNFGITHQYYKDISNSLQVINKKLADGL